MDEASFWDQVRTVARSANRAYLATNDGGQPRVRVVFPAFEERTLWIATKRTSAKARQIARDPRVELFYEASGARPIAHLTVTGTARIVDDSSAKDRLWNAGLFGYNLAEFWPRGPRSEDFALLRITPSRIELGWQPAMWVGQKPQVWKPE
ncbi:MAG: pyridoxamine 5'-phosphate oxidase family protein [Candidatus Binataceae bacterium]